jgi:hypothetical protein
MPGSNCMAGGQGHPNDIKVLVAVTRVIPEQDTRHELKMQTIRRCGKHSRGPNIEP